MGAVGTIQPIWGDPLYGTFQFTDRYGDRWELRPDRTVSLLNRQDIQVADSEY